ncbi:dicarboxylate/amino acid:cation symporter [Lacunimicrobium album]
MEHQASRFPLHLQIFVALIIGSIIGLCFNQGSTKLPDAKASLRKSVDTPAVVTESIPSAENPANTQTVYSTEFPSVSNLKIAWTAFGKQLPTGEAATNAELSYDFNVINRSVTFILNGQQADLTYLRDYVQVDKPEITQKVVTPITLKNRDELVARFPELAPAYDAARGGYGQYITATADFLGDLFLRLLKMITVPLILTSLIAGMAGLGRSHSFGKMFGITMGYYIITSIIAISTGIILVNLFNPGEGVTLPGGGVHQPQGEAKTLPGILVNLITQMIPANPFQALAGGDFLAIITFSILTGLIISQIGGELSERLTTFFYDLFEVMMRMTMMIIALAPIGVLGLMIHATATQGLSVFATVGWYMLTVFTALVFHAFITMPILVWLVARRNPWLYLKALSPALLTAFSTASSNATLPLTINCVEKRAGVSNKVSSFVLPLGATLNMDGTGLYEAVAVLFIAQATPGFELTLTTQIIVAVTALLSSAGAAGIPHAGLVMMTIILQAVGLPLEAQGIILAVDRILDMCRTTVNVWGDACGCAIVETVSGHRVYPDTNPTPTEPEPTAV